MGFGFSNRWGENLGKGDFFGDEILNFKVVLAGDGDVVRYGHCVQIGGGADFVGANIMGIGAPIIDNGTYGDVEGQKGNDGPNSNPDLGFHGASFGVLKFWGMLSVL